MFICSVRASNVKFFALIMVMLAVLLGIFITGETVFASSEVIGEVNFGGIKNAEDRIAFLAGFGIEVDSGSEASVDFVMPENFDRVMLGYNEIQKSQGLDLSKYARKKVTRYTYEVIGYDDSYDGAVYANLLVYRNKVIGCDVSSADPEGFVHPIVKGV